jgi:hypothetical protein
MMRLKPNDFLCIRYDASVRMQRMRSIDAFLRDATRSVNGLVNSAAFAMVLSRIFKRLCDHPGG